LAGLIYNLLVSLLSLLLYPAVFGKGKLAAFVKGRSGLSSRLKQSLEGKQGPVIWIHCPSLGEFEQGRTVLEKLRDRFPGHLILLTFFSPSGYEVRKEYPKADVITYLPLDTRSSVRDFVAVARPELVILIKYDFWPNLLAELELRGVPVVAVSSIFRPEQIYFRWYGGYFLQAINTIDRFFLQDAASAQLLLEHGITETAVTGDTRFDRVAQVVADAQPVIEVADFAGENTCWVVGSAWPEDMAVMGPHIAANDGRERFIIVPHEVDEQHLQSIEQYCGGRSVRWSQLAHGTEGKTVLIIDRIGLLSRVYRHATYAWVGGAFGKGLHNILEAAAYGVPVFFGDRNYKKFREAIELIAAGGAWAVGDHKALLGQLSSLKPGTVGYVKACEVSANYVRSNTGATDCIVSWCSKLLGA